VSVPLFRILLLLLPLFRAQLECCRTQPNFRPGEVGRYDQEFECQIKKLKKPIPITLLKGGLLPGVRYWGVI
jgi:hypothetical protein